jgi:hypothetical protein
LRFDGLSIYAEGIAARLSREFPPLRLAGLADGHLYWRTGEEIAADRRLTA